MAPESNNTPFAWLGLLKWSLAYSDGTTQSEAQPMNSKDIAFLEKVMAEVIIDEGERMKTILKDLTDSLQSMLVACMTFAAEQSYAYLDTIILK